MRQLRAVLLAAAAGLAIADSAPAGTISLTVTTEATPREGELAVTLTLANQGNEAARDVQATLRFGDEAASGARAPALEPGASSSQTLVVSAPGLGPGRWPFEVAIAYADANQYPFHVMHVAMVEVEGPPPTRVAVAGIEAPELAGEGALTVRVKNLSAGAQQVRLRSRLPESVEPTQPGELLALEGWEERSVAVPLVNRIALAGSRFPAFVTLEYQDGDVHQAVVAQAALAIASEPPPGPRSVRPLVWAGGVFGLLFLGLLVLRLVRREA